MQILIRWSLTLAALFGACNSPLSAQTEPDLTVFPPTPAWKGLFATQDTLSITLHGPVRKLLNNRLNSPKDFPLTLTYVQDNIQRSIPVQARTRGHYRRTAGNCIYPPLLIQFPAENPDSASIFREQHHLKLVLPCDEESYIIREWLVYKLYNLLTEQSFRARLVKVKLEDEYSKKPPLPVYGILLEEENQMASRNQMVDIERQMDPVKLRRDAYLRMTVFEYLIANTDWSAKYLHNVKLIAADPTAVPVAVPYDFDHAGIVDAPYARPAPELQMISIRQRRFRGFCVSNISTYEPVIAQFNQLKKEIYQLYTECPLLDEKYITSTVKFLDEFYLVINNPKLWQKEFSYPCELQGTQKVVIKGMKKN